GPAIKVAGVRQWGGEVVLAGRASEDRHRAAQAIAAREGLAVVPPFDHPDVVAGQATVGLEIAEELPDVQTVVVPVGGGGLISGVVVGLAAAGSRAAVWGVEPEGAPKLQRSLAAGRPTRLERTESIADGLITLTVGDVPFAHLVEHRAQVGGVALVDDESLREAVHFLWRECRLAVEPSGAATAAARRTSSPSRSACASCWRASRRTSAPPRSSRGRAKRRRRGPPSWTSSTRSPTPSSRTRSTTSWCAAWRGCCTSPSARWCSPRPATRWASWWRPTRTRCCGTSRSSWPATRRSSAASPRDAPCSSRTSARTRCTPTIACGGSATGSTYRPAPPWRCRSP